MKVLAIANQKGGVAKSTTALALGACFRATGRRVLYVDLDAQGNISYSLGANDKGGGIARAMRERTAEGCISATATGDYLLASSPGLATIDTTLTQTGKEYRLSEVLRGIEGRFDIAVLDTPPSLGLLTINALTAAHGVVIPAQADLYSLQGIAQLADTIAAVRNYCNPGLRVWGIVLTRFNGRAILSRQMAEAVEAHAQPLGMRLFKTRIRECTALKEAAVRKVDIFSYAPKSNAAADYAALFKETTEAMKDEQER